MKVINAAVSFEITTKLKKDNLDERINDYSEEIEDLLDYDCSVSDPKKIEEDNDSVTLLFPVEAYLEIVDENNALLSEEDEKKETENGAFQLRSILEDGLDGDISIVEFSIAVGTFDDIYEYKNWVLMDSILMLLSDDSDFEWSFKDLIFGDSDKEITGAHISGNGLYFQGIDDEGEHFTLGLRYTKEKNEKDFKELEAHMNEIYPAGNQFLVEIVEEGNSDDTWTVTSEDDFFGSFNIAISLRDVETEEDGFYAADSLLCCIDEDYESQIEDDFDSDFDDIE